MVALTAEALLLFRDAFFFRHVRAWCQSHKAVLLCVRRSSLAALATQNISPPRTSSYAGDLVDRSLQTKFKVAWGARSARTHIALFYSSQVQISALPPLTSIPPLRALEASDQYGDQRDVLSCGPAHQCCGAVSVRLPLEPRR